MPVETAGKALISLIVILFPISICHFIKTLGGNKWFSLFSFFLIYHYNLMWGFIAFSLGISLYFYILSVILKLDCDSKRKFIPGINLLLILALAVHYYIYILSLISFLVFSLLARPKSRAMSRFLLTSFISLISFVFYVYPLFIGKNTVILRQIIFGRHIFLHKLCSFFDSLVTGRPFDWAAMFFLTVVFCVLLWIRLIRLRPPHSDNLDKKERFIGILLVLFSMFYFLLPDHFSSLVSIVAPRIVIIIVLLLLGLVSRVKIKRPKLLMASALIMLAIFLDSLFVGFYKFDSLARPLTRVLEKTRNKKRLVQFYSYPRDSGFYFHSFPHYGCYYAVWKNGLPGHLFAQMDKWHVIKLKKNVKLPFVNVFTAGESIFPRGWENFDYFLVCGELASEYEKLLSNQQRFELIAKEGIWQLYERK